MFVWTGEILWGSSFDVTELHMSNILDVYMTNVRRRCGGRCGRHRRPIAAAVTSTTATAAAGCAKAEAVVVVAYVTVVVVVVVRVEVVVAAAIAGAAGRPARTK